MQPKDPIAAIREAFPEAVLEIIEFRGETTVLLEPSSVADVALFLRDAGGLRFNFMVNQAGVDYWPEEPRFGVVYHLYSLLFNRNLRLKVRVSEGETVPTVTPVWPTANWQEREIYDMFGVKFEGHPDMRRILMPDDWDGYPQRKDYPLGYETVQFSFNFDEIQQHKPYAKE